MSREIIRKSQFKKDYKTLLRSGKNLKELEDVIEKLFNKETLSPIYHDHKLIGQFKGCRDCHIQSDWLLIYEQTEMALILYRTGSHSELFE